MTSDQTKKNEPVFRTPNPTELKAAAVEDSILDRYPHAHDNDVNEEHPEAEIAEAVDADVDDRAPADDRLSDQTVKANLSGH